MKINKYRFKIECYFNQLRPIAGIEYDGFEIHFENMYASSFEVAVRAIRQMVIRKVGNQKARLSFLKITQIEPEVVEIYSMNLKKPRSIQGGCNGQDTITTKSI